MANILWIIAAAFIILWILGGVLWLLGAVVHLALLLLHYALIVAVIVIAYNLITRKRRL
jgi:hypothetical protein